MDNNTMIIELDDGMKADFLGLAEHIGIDPEEAMLDALSHWIGQNAAIFDYAYGTDLPKEKESN